MKSEHLANMALAETAARTGAQALRPVKNREKNASTGSVRPWASVALCVASWAFVGVLLSFAL